MFLADRALRSEPGPFLALRWNPADAERLFAGSQRSFADIVRAADASGPIAGFDLPRLLCGSLGSLGLVAEVVFRLHPLPAFLAVSTYVVAHQVFLLRNWQADKLDTVPFVVGSTLPAVALTTAWVLAPVNQ